MAEDIRKIAKTEGVEAFEAQYHAPDCVVLDSEYCSMGRMIGFLACQKAGYHYYDAVTLLELVPESGVTKEMYDDFENQLRHSDLKVDDIMNDSKYPIISDAFDQAIDIALSQGPCLIHDRIVKDAVIAKGYSCVSALTYCYDMDAKIVRAKLSPFYKDIDDKEKLIEKINEEDNIRRNWRKIASSSIWGDKESYDILLNIDAFGRDYAAELLAKVMKPE